MNGNDSGGSRRSLSVRSMTPLDTPSRHVQSKFAQSSLLLIDLLIAIHQNRRLLSRLASPPPIRPSVSHVTWRNETMRSQGSFCRLSRIGLVIVIDLHFTLAADLQWKLIDDRRLPFPPSLLFLFLFFFFSFSFLPFLPFSTCSSASYPRSVMIPPLPADRRYRHDYRPFPLFVYIVHLPFLFYLFSPFRLLGHFFKKRFF